MSVCIVESFSTRSPAVLSTFTVVDDVSTFKALITFTTTGERTATSCAKVANPGAFTVR